MNRDYGELLHQVDEGVEFTAEERDAMYQAARDAGDDALEEARREAECVDAWDGVAATPVWGTIYYIKTCCRIKIGFTVDLEQRMSQLQPDEVLATEPGTRETERKRHKMFRDAWIKGEWFRETPALLAHIQALKLGHYSLDRPGQRFVDTASAMVWTGRTRQVLYRWHREGRITRYGSDRCAQWDILELPARNADGTFPPPPKKASN